MTDGRTTLNGTANISFILSPGTLQVTNVAITIQPNATTILNIGDFNVISNSTRPGNIVVNVLPGDNTNGYFANVQDPKTPITEFTFYNIKNGKIAFVSNGTQLPSGVTVNVDDGINPPVVLNPAFSFSNKKNYPFPSFLLEDVAGGTAALIVLMFVVAAYVFWKYRFKPDQDKKRAKNHDWAVRNAESRDQDRRVPAPTRDVLTNARPTPRVTEETEEDTPYHLLPLSKGGP